MTAHFYTARPIKFTRKKKLSAIEKKISPVIIARVRSATALKDLIFAG